jgi:TPR repeat protein
MTDLDAGLRAFARGDFAVAAELLLPCAQADDIKAQLLMARLYYAGNGVEKNTQQYAYWLERAAANGDKAARAKLKRLRAKAYGASEKLSFRTT